MGKNRTPSLARALYKARCLPILKPTGESKLRNNCKGDCVSCCSGRHISHRKGQYVTVAQQCTCPTIAKDMFTGTSDAAPPAATESRSPAATVNIIVHLFRTESQQKHQMWVATFPFYMHVESLVGVVAPFARVHLQKPKCALDRGTNAQRRLDRETKCLHPNTSTTNHSQRLMLRSPISDMTRNEGGGTRRRRNRHVSKWEQCNIYYLARISSSLSGLGT